jgi:flavin reductase (DIM6/NTAB) family NADH-FMN oxidoreductase RutF
MTKPGKDRSQEPDLLIFDESAPASGEALRRAFRRHAAGVAVVTVPSPFGPAGLTVTSLASLALDPPLVSFNIAHTASAWQAVSLARFVGIHLLRADQDQLAATFARSGADRFAAPTVWVQGPRQVPLIVGCAAWMVGVIERCVGVGDHSILVVKALYAGEHVEAGDPLLYHDGGFRQLAPVRQGRTRRPA